ncbi:MAG: Glycosyl transferase group 1 [Parcubacteria group bacterium GW2011_GWA2_43_11]|nr:MAG: Glycosyl transferase group 1 [Parcubacteria group bacterium GW2011_GWA2_43_11]
MKRRILIFSLAYYPTHVSGAEVAVREITDRIDPNEYEFEMITIWFDRTQPETEKIGKVLVHRVGMASHYLTKIFFVPLAVLLARRIHKEKPFTGMWALMTYMLFPTVLARWAGIRVPYVVTLQDGDPYSRVFERWFIRPFTPILDYGFRHATVIQAISKYLAEWPVKRGSSVPVEIIYNGGNPADFKAEFDQGEIQALTGKAGKKEGEIILMTASRLEYKNAVDDVIRALPLMPEHIKFLIVGGGSEENMLRKLVKKLTLEKRVYFIGQVDRTEVPKYRYISDISVRPSRSEGLGNALISSMAAKLPVIATQEGGLADFIFDAKRNPDVPTTGWAVDKDNPEQIANAVMDIIEHPDRTQKVVTTAYDMVSRKFRWEAIAKDMQTKVFSRLTAHE